MRDYQRVIDLSDQLIEAVSVRDGLLMQQRMDALDRAYKEEFGDSLDGFDAIRAFFLMNLAGAKYFAYNNMFQLVHTRYNEVKELIDRVERYSPFSTEQKAEIRNLFNELRSIYQAIPQRHCNRVVGRLDTRCCLCREMPANKAGSHMVPNFLSHPTFSWDGKGKRFHEALNHDFLNALEMNCQFYGREVPEWRFAKGEGKTEVTDEDIERNINPLEYDNEFCSRCEDRFGVLESAYSQFYGGQQKNIHPRVAYLFWLSVLWRMSMGSMSIFMDMKDELSLRKLLDENMLGTVKDIKMSVADLGTWQYAIFRATGLRDGDKGILGYRKESSPYVVMYNDLVMVFYNDIPTEDELIIGPIAVQRELLNNWHSPEKSMIVGRRWFWDVRDWLVESDYDYYDPVREKTLISIREQERSEDRVITGHFKAEAIKVARLKEGPKDRLIRLRKMERISGAWSRKKEAEKKGTVYDPLKDEELFLQQRDFDMYYHDLAVLARGEETHDAVAHLPFYDEARKAIPDVREWSVRRDEDNLDPEYVKALDEYIRGLSDKELDHLLYGVSEPYVKPLSIIGRNDLCPCGSGKKYKKCCGRVNGDDALLR